MRRKQNPGHYFGDISAVVELYEEGACISIKKYDNKVTTEVTNGFQTKGYRFHFIKNCNDFLGV